MALAMQPDNPVALSMLWLAASTSGRHTEAIEAAKTYLNVCYADPAVEEALEQGWEEGGYTEAMGRAAAALEERSRTLFVSPSDIAMLCAYAHEYGKALDWLERGFEARDPTLPYLNLLVNDPLLRSDPRFQDLLRRMNLPGD